MSDWKREIKKEEKRKEIKYAKRKRKEAIENSLQREMRRRKGPTKEGPLKTIESDLKRTEEAIKDIVSRNKKK